MDKLTDAEVLRIIREQAKLVSRQTEHRHDDSSPMPAADVARSGALWDYLTGTLGMSPERAEAVMRKG